MEQALYSTSLPYFSRAADWMGTEMSGLFFSLGLFMVADSSYIVSHVQLLEGRHR